MLRLLIVLCLLINGAHAGVPLRVVTFNIEAGFVGSDRQPSIPAPGTDDYESVRAILARIDADVVCLQEVFPADDNPANFFNLARDLGYDHALLSTRSNSFDFQLRNGVFSRYPFLDEQEIGSAGYNDSLGLVGDDGSRAREVTRTMPAVVIDVPGALQPTTIVSLHNKAGGGAGDLYRRAIELARVRDYLDRNGLDGEDNLIVTGDFNISASSPPVSRTFTSEPNVPQSFNRGSDLPLPITFSDDVDFYFPAPFNLTALDARAVNGSDATFQRGGGTLDYVMSSPAMRVMGSEVYRSELDTSDDLGLPKSGNPLASNLSAVASDHWAVFADFELVGLDPRPMSYSLTDAMPSIREDFDGFGGGQAPARWSSSSSDWAGFFFEQMAVANYAFDDAGDRSVGALVGATPSRFSTLFDNDTGAPIEALELSFLARQITANSPGTDDSLTATLTIGEEPPIDLPDLTFTAAAMNRLPFSETVATTVEGLMIPPGSSFTLTLSANRGPTSEDPVSEQVFLNEFHYDNAGGDSGEFIEVVVAPGFEAAGGRLSDVAVELYNGASTSLSTYDSVNLSEFDNFENPTISNGYRIYSTAIVLQNGGPDGLAVVVGNSVVQFLSYEGTFTAAAGPAAGMTAVDVGVAQSPPFEAGFGSIGLSGAGIDATELAWQRFGEAVAHTPGQLNPGQTFTGAIPERSQALSFDAVTVAIAAPSDFDNDGVPDATDPDDDNDLLPDVVELLLGLSPLSSDSDGNGTLDGDEDSDGDGLSNLIELQLTGTDPADRNSRFTVRIGRDSGTGDGLDLIFPTLQGRNYRVLSGPTPDSLAPLITLAGDGEPRNFRISTTQAARFYAVEVLLADE